MKKICVFGSLNIDMTIFVPHFNAPGETLTGTGMSIFTGGKGGNQAVACARLGAPVKMIGCLGDDANGGMYYDTLVKEGVDVSGLRRCENITSGIAFIEVVPEGENRIALAVGANGLLTPEVARDSEAAIAECGERAQVVALGKLQARAIAGDERGLVARGHPVAHDGSHRVEHVGGRQVVALGDLCRARALLVALDRHQSRARQAELHAGKGVDRVVDAAVVWRKAAQHLAVGSVHDAIHRERGDVSAPQVDVLLQGREVLQARHALLAGALLEVGVLHGEKVVANRLRRSHVEERAEQGALVVGAIGDADLRILLVLGQQGADQPEPAFVLRDGQIVSHANHLQSC